MCQPRKWVIGLAPLALLALLMLWLRPGPMTTDIAARANAELTAQGHTWASVTLAGRDATLAGQAPTPESQALAIQAADRVAGLRRVTNATTLIAEQNPYRWGATREGARLALTGFVPNDGVRADLTNAARRAFPGAEVVDQMQLARGAPAGFAAAAGLGIAELGRLTEGRATIENRAFALTGLAPSLEVFGAAREVASRTPQGFQTTADVSPPRASPYLFAAARDAAGVTLTGNVPSEAARAAVLGAARSAMAGVTVTDQMTLASGAPAGYETAAGFALSQLGRLSSGRASLSDTNFAIEGLAAAEAVAAGVTQASGQPPQGFRLASAQVASPRISPYVFQAVRGADSLTLTGYVPDEAARAAALAAARAAMPGVTVVDQLQLGRGAPEGFGAAAALALGQLGRLTTGRAGLSDTALTITGEAPDGATAAAVGQAVARVPGGFRLAEAAITSPIVSPYVMSVVREGSTVALTGHVPDEATRAQILAAVRAAAPQATISDRMSFGRGAPDGFAGRAAFVAGEAAKLEPGSGQLTDNSMILQGRARTFPVYDAALTALRQPPAGLIVARQDITPPTVSPYTWSAAYAGGQVVLEGHVPSEAARAQIVAAVRAATPSATVVDRMRLAEGAPAGFGQAAAFGVGQFGRFSEGRAALSDQAFSISGRGFEGVDSAAVAAAGAAQGGLPAGMRLAQNEVVAALPTVRPYVMAMTRDAQGLTLEGVAPNEAAKAAIVEAARAAVPGAAVTERIRIAQGVPAGMDWVAANRFALAQVARLRVGRASFQDQAFTIDGDAADRPGYVAANNAVRAASLAGAATLASATIRPPAVSPYIWFVDKGPAAVVLQGFVPSEAAKTANVEAARQAFTPSPVRDAQELGVGAPAGFAEATAFAIAETARLEVGRGSIADGALQVTGRAASEPTAASVRAAVQFSGPSAFARSHFITVTGAAAPAGPAPAPIILGPQFDPCALRVREILAAATINFRTGSDDIDPASFPLLDSIVGVLRDCPATRFQVEGHTDSVGARDMNLDLSERRARAVVTYIAGRGVNGDRLAAQGFGPDRPVAPNDTPANRGQNRRIEFTVRQ